MVIKFPKSHFKLVINLSFNFQSLSVTTVCKKCGGFGLLPCPICNGSKKSVHRNNFTERFVALRCSNCDESALVKCDAC